MRYEAANTILSNGLAFCVSSVFAPRPRKSQKATLRRQRFEANRTGSLKPRGIYSSIRQLAKREGWAFVQSHDLNNLPSFARDDTGTI